MSVIDLHRFVAQSQVVITHTDIMRELVRQLDQQKVQAKQVAEHLGIAAPRVTEMRKGTRRIQQHEMEPLARYLGMTDEVEITDDEAVVVSIWSRIPSDRRDHALEVFKSFAAKDK